MNRKMKHFQKCGFLLFFHTFLLEFGSLQEHNVPFEYTFCFLCRENCLRNNSSRKYIDLFSTVFKKIITDATTRNFQKVGGVLQPLIFHQG